MASAVDPSSSPRSARPARNLSASWSHIAAAAPSTPLADPISFRDSSERSLQKSSPDSQLPPASESPDHVIDGNAAAATSRSKKTVWNVPPNGSGLSEGGAVMDAAYWPALSESAKASPKSSSSDSSKGLADGSISVNLGSVSPSSKPASSTPNPSLMSIPSPSALHKTTKQSTNAVSDGSSGSDVLNGGLASEPPSSALSAINQSVQDTQPSPKGLTNKSSSNTNHNWDSSSRAAGISHHPHGGNDHPRGYGGGRRGNNGQHNSYGNRRDPERGGYEWNPRNFVRDVRMQQLHPQWGVRPYPRPPPVAAQLIAPPPPPRPFGHNMGFHDLPSAIYYVPAPPHPESLRGLPFASHPAPVPAPPVMVFHAPDPQRAMLLKQIDYYFSPENLCKDTYLRNYMDEQGWVHISVIAGFNRVKQLTNNIQYIIDTLRLSSVVEVQGDKIRRRNDWSKWLNTANQFSSSSSSQSPTAAANYDAMAAQFHNIGLEESSNHSSIVESAETALAGSTSLDGQH